MAVSAAAGAVLHRARRPSIELPPSRIELPPSRIGLTTLPLLGVLICLCACGPLDPPEQRLPAHVASSAAPLPTALLPHQGVEETLNVPQPEPPASPPERIHYPAADIDLPVQPLTPRPEELGAGSLVPPATTDAYWLTPYGQPGSGSDNTTYIVGHSWENTDAPFNRLSSRSAPGDDIEIITATGTVTYKVNSVTTHDKDTLRDSDVWRVMPGRLVLISCYTEDLWGKNVIVTALPK